jgi:pre-mRNA-splicing factor SYF2
MNQARQLNQQAVQREGERLSRPDAERKKQHAADRQREREAWEARHARALGAAEALGVEGRHLTEQAHDSLRRAQSRAERAEAARHSARDYHNPEGQARNYQRNLKSLPRERGASGGEGSASAAATFDPLDGAAGTGGSLADERERERRGARRLADELHRRIDRQKAAQLEKRVREESEEAAGDGATHINKRNRLFNEKIKRNYDPHTAEIRQNLERGTAL